MRIDNADIEIIKKDIKHSLKSINICGMMGKRKIISKIGKECADGIVEAMFAQLSAFDKEEADHDER